MPSPRHPLIAIAKDLSDALAPLRFAAPITHVYDPLVYAAKPHALYVERYGSGPREVLLLGMNPGPFGMAQTGVPFGEIAHVRDWLGVEAPVDKPHPEHPARPIQGFACARQEVSGARFWGWAKATFGAPERFFARFFVANYCPLVFMEQSGKNFTPDKLPARERDAVYAACDEALRRTALHFRAKWVIGVGAFAEARAKEALQPVELSSRAPGSRARARTGAENTGVFEHRKRSEGASAGRAADESTACLSETGILVGRILHPSPASPAANSDWAGKVTKELADMGIAFP